MSRLRVAVIGAGGQIGRTVLARLAAEASIDVRGICRNELTAAPLRLAGFDIRCGSVSDPEQAQKLLGDRDVLVNLSSASGLPGTARREDRANVRGMLGVRGPRRFVHFSSVAAYGTCVDARRNTFDHPRPDHAAGRDKLNLERFVQRVAAESPIRELAIFRLGHVYGAEQWVSKFCLDLAKRDGWRLPFDGRMPSNAIHVKNVASAVRTVVLGDQLGLMNLTEGLERTWRDVFDWNTNAAGLPRVPGLDDASSQRGRDYYGRIARTPNVQVVREVAAWGRTLPLSLISASPALRFLGLKVMATLQSPSLEAHILKRFTGAQLARRVVPMAVEHPWLVSDGVPGRYMEYPREVTAEDALAVARWHHGYASPDALTPFAPRAHGGVDEARA